MRWNFALGMAWVIGCLGIAVGSASAAPIVIDFDSETPFANVPNGFTTDDSAEVHFTDTLGAQLLIFPSAGNNGLAVLFADSSALLITFDFQATEIMMDFGNDVFAGQIARLTAFDGATALPNPSEVLTDGDALINQSIAYSGGLFDSVIFEFDLNPQLNLAGLEELVDNIVITPDEVVIPEPTGAVLFGLGAVLIGTASRRRPRI